MGRNFQEFYRIVAAAFDAPRPEFTAGRDTLSAVTCAEFGDGACGRRTGRHPFHRMAPGLIPRIFSLEDFGVEPSPLKRSSVTGAHP
jgi:hypothetical protein